MKMQKSGVMIMKTEEWEKKIAQYVPTDELKIQLIMTSLGCGSRFMQFIDENFYMKDIPIEIKYYITIIASILLAFEKENPEMLPPKWIDLRPLQLPIKEKLVYALRELCKEYKEEIGLDIK